MVSGTVRADADWLRRKHWDNPEMPPRTGIKTCHMYLYGMILAAQFSEYELEYVSEWKFKDGAEMSSGLLHWTLAQSTKQTAHGSFSMYAEILPGSRLVVCWLVCGKLIEHVFIHLEMCTMWEHFQLKWCSHLYYDAEVIRLKVLIMSLYTVH